MIDINWYFVLERCIGKPICKKEELEKIEEGGEQNCCASQQDQDYWLPKLSVIFTILDYKVAK